MGTAVTAVHRGRRSLVPFKSPVLTFCISTMRLLILGIALLRAVALTSGQRDRAHRGHLICSNGCKPTCTDGALPLCADGTAPTGGVSQARGRGGRRRFVRAPRDSSEEDSSEENSSEEDSSEDDSSEEDSDEDSSEENSKENNDNDNSNGNGNGNDNDFDNDFDNDNGFDNDFDNDNDNRYGGWGGRGRYRRSPRGCADGSQPACSDN